MSHTKHPTSFESRRATQVRARSIKLINDAIYAMTLAILAPVFRCRLALARADVREGMYPTDNSHLIIPGRDTLRVLIVGDTAAAGFGVRTHQLGIAGQLARELATLTCRGVHVQTRADPSLTASSTPALLEEVGRHEFDAIILMLATNDAMALTATRAWSRDMRRSIALLKRVIPQAGFVTTIADIGAIERLAFVTRLVCGKHARVLNRETAGLCATLGNSLIRLDSAHGLNSATYEAWASRIAASVGPTIAPVSGTWPPQRLTLANSVRIHERSEPAV